MKLENFIVTEYWIISVLWSEAGDAIKRNVGGEFDVWVTTCYDDLSRGMIEYKTSERSYR